MNMNLILRSVCTLCVLLLFCNSPAAYAQQLKLTGTVSATNGDLLPGVTVTEKGTTHGTVTGPNGQFQLQVAAGATLVFNYVGFDGREVKTSNARNISVVLQRSTRALNEVMVVGYGSKNKSTFAGAAVTLNAEDLNKNSLSVANLLQGRASGVQVTQNNGTPGAPLTIRIRGTNSINADSDPLYVIDGFPTNDGVGFTISPEDIASISILKDAASTAIYGARGANGVVLVTTKSGRNKKNNLSLHSYYGQQKVVNRFDMAGPYDNATRLNALFVAQGSTAPYSQSRLDSLKAGYIGTDWQSKLFRTANVQNHTISFTGGNPNTAVYSSLDYLDQEGVVLNSRYRRVGARVNVDEKVGDKFSMSARVFGNYGIQNDLPLAPSTINGFLKQAIKANPASDFGAGENIQLDAQNPLHFIAATKRGNYTYRTNAYFSLRYEPVKGLVLQSDQGTDLNSTRIKYFAPASVPAGVSGNGLATVTDIAESELIFNPTATYSFNIRDHHLKFLAGYNTQTYYYEEQGITATNFSSDELGFDNLATAQQFSAYSGKTRIRRKSWFGRVDYDFRNKYILTGIYRIDGSSVFGTNNKLGYFPSGSFAWRFSEEDFVKNLQVLSSGKLRVSYGVTGNDRVRSGLSAANFAADNTTKYTLNGVDQLSGIAITNLSNPNLKWEQTGALDVGLDVGFFKDRVILEADYYDKKTTSLLLNRSIAPSTGFQTLFGNDGSVSNKGVELSLQTVNMDGRFRWSSTFTYTHNRNKVLSLGDNNSDIYVGSLKPDGAADFETPFIIRKGQAIGSLYGFVYKGIVQPNDPALSSTQPNSTPGEPLYADVNGDGKVDANDRIILGVGIPTSFYGFTNTFSYRNFNLDVVMQGQTGGKLLNLQKEDLLNPISQGNTLKSVATDTWSATHLSGSIPPNGFYGNPYGGWVNTRFTESSDYIRLKNVTLTYNLPAALLQHVGIAALSVYANVQNLWTWTKYTGLDPEVGNLVDSQQQNQNAGRGIDFNAYPVNKMYVLGAKVTF